MKKQNKLSIKVRDLEPLKDVIGGRRRRRTHGTLGAKGSQSSSANTEVAWVSSATEGFNNGGQERTARGPIPCCGS